MRFVAVQIDGLGTNHRGKAFSDFSYRNLGDGGIPDHIALMRRMAESYPYMDLERVGIWGGSAGGYDSTRAILMHPGFYDAAVSTSGNHDHRLDKANWVEMWIGFPLGEHYALQSNAAQAHRLEGELLLAHGELDALCRDQFLAKEEGEDFVAEQPLSRPGIDVASA